MRLEHREGGEVKVRLEGTLYARKLILSFRDFISIRETEGWPLLCATVVALALANSPWSADYLAFWNDEIMLRFGRTVFTNNPHHLVNDLLLPVFFFILGLDLKHELVVGELSSWKQAAMPVFIGVGGMLVPILVFLLFNQTGQYTHGWGVPVATDVAFTLAVLMMLGDRIPLQLKILTIAFAAVDDIGGVLVIALFYSKDLSLWYLAATFIVFIGIILLRLLRLRAVVLYALMVSLLMVVMYLSGVHTTIAGVALGLLVPARPMFRREKFVSRIDDLNEEVQELRQQIQTLDGKDCSQAEFEELEELRNEEEAVLGQMEMLVRGTESGVERLLRTFNPWVSYIVLPVFALANAGIRFDPSLFESTLSSHGVQGILVGLLAGKPLGIIGAAYLAWKLRLAILPTGVGWHHLVGMGLLAGMGFTVSIFIAGLAYDSPELLNQAKLAVILASFGAGVIGYLFLRVTCSNEEHPGQ